VTLETFLARLYVDAEARRRFLGDPVTEARRAGLTTADAERLAAVDRDGLELAATSYARKRAAKAARPPRWRRLLRFALT